MLQTKRREGMYIYNRGAMLILGIYVVFIVFLILLLFVFIAYKSKSSEKNQFFKKLNGIIVPLAFIIVTGITITELIAIKADRTERKNIHKISQIIAASINPAKIASLKGNLDDLNNSNYHDIRNQLMRIQKVTKSIRWIYMMSKNDSGFFFTVDNVPLDIFGHVEPGQAYYEQPPPELQTVLDSGGSAVVGPYIDEWGTFVSGFAAVKDSSANAVLMILGVDIDAIDWNTILVKARIAPLLITLMAAAIMLIIAYERSKLLRKNSELVDYIHTVTHDLKKPLTGLKTVISLLEKNDDTNTVYGDRMKDLLSVGSSSIAHMQRMLEDLLTVAKIEWGDSNTHIEKTDMKDFIEKLLDLHKIEIEHTNAKVTFDGKGNLNINRNLFEKMFNNLLDNALKYKKEATHPIVNIKFVIENNFATLSVRDNGRGIKESERESIFERFIRGTNAGTTSGTGLGLYICKLSSQKMGGNLTFECHSEGGTEFIWKKPC